MSNKVKILIVVLISAGMIFFFQQRKDNAQYIAAMEDCEILEDTIEKPEQFFLYGIPADSFHVIKNKIKRNEFVADILTGYGISNQKVLEMTGKSRDVFDVRRFRYGNPYTVFLERDSSKAAYFAYEINDVEYVVYDFVLDSVYRDEKETYVMKKVATGIIQSSLYETLKDANANPLLTYELSDIFAWVIDFYRLQKGDRFKVVYHEHFVEGKSAGIDKVVAAVFNHYGNDFYAFYFQPDSVAVGNYYDEFAESLRKAFLKAPLKYSRISSKYSKRRFHPVLKRYKAHLGTDYAAPTGTPIMSVGDGIVEEARYKKNNGNYVKIKHNSTYSTQYLHMSKFASGIRPGVKVVQGQTIGYVGSTGLATGPHVCFRFWKNGVQVDPLKLKIPPSKPVEEKYLTEYNKVIKELQMELDNIEYPTPQTALSSF